MMTLWYAGLVVVATVAAFAVLDVRSICRSMYQ